MESRPSDTVQTRAETLRSRRRGWWSAALLAAIVTVGMGLAGCGGGSPSASSNASASGCSPSGCPSHAASAVVEAMAVTFSACMRSHGVTDFPDPTIGSNGLPTWPGNVSAHAHPAAQRACDKDLPNLEPQTSEQKATAHAEALKYATCMRSHGVPNFPDPNGEGLIQISNATGSLDPNSPQYLKAAAACKGLDNGFAQQSSGTSVSSGSGTPGGGS